MDFLEYFTWSNPYQDYKNGKPQFTIVSIQAFLSSMLIGIYVANIKIGSSPLFL